MKKVLEYLLALVISCMLGATAGMAMFGLLTFVDHSINEESPAMCVEGDYRWTEIFNDRRDLKKAEGCFCVDGEWDCR